MATFSTSSGFIINCSLSRRALVTVPPSLLPPTRSYHNPSPQKPRKLTVCAAKFGGISIKSANNCKTCKAKGAVECPGCKGTGKNKKNGNIFERWKCFDCQGFGMRSCPECGKGGLTPEQRGER